MHTTYNLVYYTNILDFNIRAGCAARAAQSGAERTQAPLEGGEGEARQGQACHRGLVREAGAPAVVARPRCRKNISKKKERSADQDRFLGRSKS